MQTSISSRQKLQHLYGKHAIMLLRVMETYIADLWAHLLHAPDVLMQIKTESIFIFPKQYVGHQDLDIQLKWKVSLLGTFVKKDFLLVNRWTFNRISDNPGGIWSHVETAFLEFKNCSPPTTPSPSSRYLGTPRFNINSEVALPLIRIQACPALLRWFDGIIVAGL
ncbi:hypothetical protein V6N11_074301 [Hibiscus sabdariffa]|uniref:Uncharacterized protein n=1 Tax=Hibiscus sabdariffa TaxID=183260 RepID=A0ABR2R3H2_9ROSI